MIHSISWYKPGKKINVHDRMQQNYVYELTELPGKNFAPDFKPELTPEQMLQLGVFEGKYLTDCRQEFPREWYDNAELSPDKADVTKNFFKIKSRLSLTEWRKRGWIPLVPGDPDVRGWFQWYCRYWLGRRDARVDARQIKRWRAFIRHKAQIMHSLTHPLNKLELMHHRPRQRQALLQWAYNPFVNF